ncbi:unnamed protein product [Cochlearia groenlandica]
MKHPIHRLLEKFPSISHLLHLHYPPPSYVRVDLPSFHSSSLPVRIAPLIHLNHHERYLPLNQSLDLAAKDVSHL